MSALWGFSTAIACLNRGAAKSTRESSTASGPAICAGTGRAQVPTRTVPNRVEACLPRSHRNALVNLLGIDHAPQPQSAWAATTKNGALVATFVNSHCLNINRTQQPQRRTQEGIAMEINFWLSSAKHKFPKNEHEHEDWFILSPNTWDDYGSKSLYRLDY